jgi:preprotein translocase subunit SecD
MKPNTRKALSITRNVGGRASRHIRVRAILIGMLLVLLLPGFGQQRQNEKTGQKDMVRVVFRAQLQTGLSSKTGNTLETVRRILEARARNKGVKEATFTAQPPDQIMAQLPRSKADKAFLQYLTAPAKLELYLLPQLGSRDGSMPAKWRVSEDPKTREEILVDTATGQPLTKKQMNALIFNRPAPLSSKTLLPRCRAIIQPGGRPVIEFELNAEGARILEEVTRANIGKFLAIFLDRQLLTAPNINSAILGGKGILDGNFTPESAKALAAQLNAGFLPVPVTIIRL